MKNIMVIAVLTDFIKIGIGKRLSHEVEKWVRDEVCGRFEIEDRK